MFISRRLTPAERAYYSQLQREGLSIVFGVTRLHQYFDVVSAK